MSDHNLDLALKRINDDIKLKNADLQAKRNEVMKLDGDMKTWEQNLKLGKPKLEALKKEVHTLEVNVHTKLDEIQKMERLHREELAKMQREAKNVKPSSPHTPLI
jgi:chromosome segregation ATPase